MSSANPEIFTDSQTRYLYANDASIYEELPSGVAFPKSVNDIQALVQKAGREGFSIIPRSAGTSLAGQTTGSGVILDVSRYMNRVQRISPKEKFARVQPGVIRDTLNRQLACYKLEFGPDTATTNRCMMGGMIGNNSCGAFSIKHKTTREHVLEIEAVLSDGSIAVFKPLSADELEQKKRSDSLEGHIYRGVLELLERNRDKISEAYPHPEIIRRNTGYALDRLCEMQPFNKKGRRFNMAELLCGSEGTLAVTTSAKVRLVVKSTECVVLVPHFKSISAATKAAVEAVKHEPAAVELIDDIILNATKDNLEQRRNRFFLEGEPKCILIIQFEGNDSEQLTQKAEALKKALLRKGLSNAIPVIADDEKIERVWHLRKAGLGLLMGLSSDEKSPSFCEDTAVRVEDLPAYVNDFQQLLKKHRTHCVFYGHASVGELHLRPVINTQTEEGVQKMKIMAEEAAALVASYNGSLSGEHGDGRARAPYIEKVLGKEMTPLLQQVKEIWDPNYIFNPGKIVKPKPIEEGLRVAASWKKEDEPKTMFHWRKEDGFSGALDLCNGAGVCRKLAESGGTMCPSYMATKEEKDSTRGRANLFRQLFVGKGAEAFSSEELYDALDLCISCKGCKSECPANVDMARMKAEFMQGRHDEKGITLSERFFGQAGMSYPLASKFSNITNWLVSSSFGKEMLLQLFNISPKRTLPTFAKETFMEWFNKRGGEGNGRIRPISKLRQDFLEQAKTDVGRTVALFIDIFTNYHEPETGKAAVRFLEGMGCEVLIPEFHELGRTQISKGILRQAKKVLDNNLPKLTAYVEQNIPVIGLEPSEILTLRDEYVDLCNDDQLDAAKAAAKNSFTFEEFAARVLSDQQTTIVNHPEKKVYMHGHCHAKALIGQTALADALISAGYEPQILDTGCCGMAGSFGYEADHYEISMDIGELRLFPALRSLPENALICAPGFSCRHQVMDGTERKAYHPAELLYKSLI